MNDETYVPAAPGSGKLLKKVRKDKGTKKPVRRWRRSWRLLQRFVRDLVEVWLPGLKAMKRTQACPRMGYTPKGRGDRLPAPPPGGTGERKP